MGRLLSCPEYLEVREQERLSKEGLKFTIAQVQHGVDAGTTPEGIYGQMLFLRTRSDNGGRGTNGGPPAAPECLPDPTDRGDGRNAAGQFANGNTGFGKLLELQALRNYALDFGVDVVITKVRARLSPSGIRYYDGLVENPDGSYTGIEVKSNSACHSPNQREFDGRVNSGEVATASLNGRLIRITRAIEQRI